MAMGQRTHEEQTGMWVAVSDLPRSVSHPFYEKLTKSAVGPAWIRRLRRIDTPGAERVDRVDIMIDIRVPIG
jgi:hypothetical protein